MRDLPGTCTHLRRDLRATEDPEPDAAVRPRLLGRAAVGVLHRGLATGDDRPLVAVVVVAAEGDDPVRAREEIGEEARGDEEGTGLHKNTTTKRISRQSEL